VPYLVPADSDGDKNAPNYLWENEFSKKELKKLLESAFPDGDFSSSGEEFLKVEKCSESGTVLSAVAGGIKVSGQDIRSALSLRSAAFDVDWDGDVCKITTKGYGHGVGMSQYGANSMAKSGANWKEILQHYYTDAEICKVK
jgi:stage II sporulation protein D